MRRAIRFVFRGVVRTIESFDPTTTALDWLREEQRATGTKEGCNEGDCGACTAVLLRRVDGRLDYRPVNTCILLLGQLDGAELITIEDLASGGELHPVQRAMVEAHGSQCGFCTPGIVMSLFAAFHAEKRPETRDELADHLAGNLCRCTGYRPILDAGARAMAGPADAFDRAADAHRAALAALDEETDLSVPDGDGFFAAPASLDSAARLAAEHPDATLLGGATDVGLWITKKLAPLRKIIWLGRVRGLDAIESRPDALFLGATVRHASALPHLQALDADLGEVMRRFGAKQVRASGTVGGNLANGSPIGDLAPCLIALGAAIHLRHGERTRDLPLENFFLAYGKQDRAAGELVTGVTIPKLAPDQRFRAFKISKRSDEDISTVLGAFRFTLAEGRIATARIAFGGMAGVPKRAPAAEAALVGVSLADPHEWARASFALDTDFAPLSDMRASAEYRRKTARALLGKALLELAGAPNATRLRGRIEAA